MDKAISFLIIGILVGIGVGAAVGYGITFGSTSSLQAQVSTLQSQVASLQSQNDQLNSQFSVLQTNYSQLNSESQALKLNLTQLISENQALADENAELRQQLNASIRPQCLYLFTSDGCHSCELANTYVMEVGAQYPILSIHLFEVHNITSWDLMVSLYQAHGITFYSTPVVFIGDGVLSGLADIEDRLVPIILSNAGALCPSIG